MMKSYLGMKLLGVLVLVAVLLITTNVVKQSSTTTGEAPGGFSTNEQFVGQVGGVHYLRNGVFTDEGNFYRLEIETQLNRASTLEDSIATPYTTATVAKQGSRSILTLKVLDTTRMYAEEGRYEDIYTGVNGAVTTTPPIIKVNVAESTEEGQQIQIEVPTTELKYKLQVSPQNPSHIWVDILK